jgi:hypothetical protein
MFTFKEVVEVVEVGQERCGIHVTAANLSVRVINHSEYRRFFFLSTYLCEEVNVLFMNTIMNEEGEEKEKRQKEKKDAYFRSRGMSGRAVFEFYF